MKIHKLKSNYRYVFVVAVMSLTSAAAFGQMNNKLAQMQQENAAKLREYNWKSRTEIRKGGETKIVHLNQMRFAIDGTLQQTQLSERSPELPTSGLRGMIAKKKREEFAKILDGLGALAKSYGNLPPEKMQRLMANATLAPEKNVQQNLIRIQGRDVLQPGDSMTIWVDVATRKQRKIEIQTMFETKPVRIVSEFRDLPNGPTYLARSVIEYTAQELVITTDNFEYERKREALTGGKI